MINPILERELKIRMRSWKTPILLIVFLGLLALIIGFYFLTSSYSYNSFGPKIAIDTYNVIVIAQFCILMLIVPALTAISISGERERQTLDLMLCTDLNIWQIIFGKISASLSFIFIIILAAMPFMGIVFLFGGISLWEIVKIVLYYMLTAFMVSTVGTFCSIFFKKNITSIIMTYLIIGILFVGTIVFFAISRVIIYQVMYDYEFFDKYLYEISLLMFTPNPGYGLLSLVFGSGNLMQNLFYTGMGSSTFLRNVEPWMTSSAFSVLFSGILLLLSRWKLGRLK